MRTAEEIIRETVRLYELSGLGILDWDNCFKAVLLEEILKALDTGLTIHLNKNN
jgi:hypothetical protein